MNASLVDYPLSTSTWLTFAMMMLIVRTPKDRTTAHVWRDTLEMDEIVTVSYNNLSLLFISDIFSGNFLLSRSYHIGIGLPWVWGFSCDFLLLDHESTFDRSLHEGTG